MSLQGLTNLSNLEVLSAEGNKIATIHSDHLTGLTALKVVNLSDNKISDHEQVRGKVIFHYISIICFVIIFVIPIDFK